MTGQPAAVVIPADRPASLGIARSLGRRGIPVYAVDADPRAIGLYSRYVNPCPLPGDDFSDEKRLQFLIDLGKKLGQRPVLYPVSDDEVILCSRERDELQKYYRYVMPDHSTIMSLLTKDGLHRVARDCQIPDPQMFTVGSQAQVETLVDQACFQALQGVFGQVIADRDGALGQVGAGIDPLQAGQEVERFGNLAGREAGKEYFPLLLGVQTPCQLGCNSFHGPLPGG